MATRSARQGIGGFGNTAKYLSGDDDLLLHRIQRECPCRINFAVSPGSAVYNDPPPSFRAFLRQRIRFASKHLAYPFSVKIILGGIYAFYASLVGLTVATSLSLSYLPVLLTALGMKIVCELSFLTRGQHLLEKRKLLKFYPIAVIPHILYIITVPLLGQLIKNRW